MWKKRWGLKGGKSLFTTFWVMVHSAITIPSLHVIKAAEMKGTEIFFQTGKGCHADSQEEVEQGRAQLSPRDLAFSTLGIGGNSHTSVFQQPTPIQGCNEAQVPIVKYSACFSDWQESSCCAPQRWIFTSHTPNMLSPGTYQPVSTEHRGDQHCAPGPWGKTFHEWQNGS